MMMPKPFLICLILCAACLCAAPVRAIDNSFTEQQIKAAAQAEETQAEEERNRETAPWHFSLAVKNAHRGYSHAGNQAVFEGRIAKIYKSPSSESSVQSQTIHFSYYCGNATLDDTVDPCKPYLSASYLEIWGKFSWGSNGDVMPDSLIVLSMEPQ